MNSSELAAGRNPAPKNPPTPAAARFLFAMLERLHCGTLHLTCPDGRTLRFSGAQPGPEARLVFGDWQLARDVLRAGDIGFAEAWFDGRWQTDDLTGLLLLMALNEQAIEYAFHGHWLGTMVYRLRHLLRGNTQRGSRRNIHAHYDLGNAFYRLWLDPSMTYSAALFNGDAGVSLDAAQQAKYDRILDRLGVVAGDHILEIGCGWGGFACRAATRGCRVTGITVSNSQLEYARQRVTTAGLEHQVHLEFRDYRDLTGDYDHVVSIEMYEAVGERYWPGYFKVVHDRLKPGGRAVIQAITIAESKFERYRRGTDFIQQYIFPGGMLASPTRFAQEAETAGLRVAGQHAFGADYAMTLQRWDQNFTRTATEVGELGFDPRFQRLWHFYLAYCAAGFLSGATDVFQFELAHR